MSSDERNTVSHDAIDDLANIFQLQCFKCCSNSYVRLQCLVDITVDLRQECNSRMFPLGKQSSLLPGAYERQSRGSAAHKLLLLQDLK